MKERKNQIVSEFLASFILALMGHIRGSGLVCQKIFF